MSTLRSKKLEIKLHIGKNDHIYWDKHSLYRFHFNKTTLRGN